MDDAMRAHLEATNRVLERLIRNMAVVRAIDIGLLSEMYQVFRDNSRQLREGKDDGGTGISS